jgi:hypothetical protein
MKDKSKMKDKPKSKEPFPSDKTPRPPQVINPNEIPETGKHSGDIQDNNTDESQKK